MSDVTFRIHTTEGTFDVTAASATAAAESFKKKHKGVAINKIKVVREQQP